MHKIILIGDPVAHSRSPRMQNAALAQLGFAAEYAAVQTPAEELAARVASLRAAEYLGANVTLPHKEAVIPFLDAIEESAARIGAVNTIYKRDGQLIGANTDAPGFLADLAAAGFDPSGRIAVILGASGAARAAAYALFDAGAAMIVVANRTPERAEELLGEILLTSTDEDGLLPSGDLPPRLVALPLGDPDLRDYLAEGGLLVNATSLGWHGEATPWPDPPVGAGVLVYDMVYRQTPLLCEAVAKGAATRDGRGMLAYQGAFALERWVEQEAPIDLMLATLMQE